MADHDRAVDDISNWISGIYIDPRDRVAGRGARNVAQVDHGPGFPLAQEALEQLLQHRPQQRQNSSMSVTQRTAASTRRNMSAIGPLPSNGSRRPVRPDENEEYGARVGPPSGILEMVVDVGPRAVPNPPQPVQLPGGPVQGGGIVPNAPQLGQQQGVVVVPARPGSQVSGGGVVRLPSQNGAAYRRVPSEGLSLHNSRANIFALHNCRFQGPLVTDGGRVRAPLGVIPEPPPPPPPPPSVYDPYPPYPPVPICFPQHPPIPAPQPQRAWVLHPRPKSRKVRSYWVRPVDDSHRSGAWGRAKDVLTGQGPDVYVVRPGGGQSVHSAGPRRARWANYDPDGLMEVAEAHERGEIVVDEPDPVLEALWARRRGYEVYFHDTRRYGLADRVDYRPV